MADDLVRCPNCGRAGTAYRSRHRGRPGAAIAIDRCHGSSKSVRTSSPSRAENVRACIASGQVADICRGSVGGSQSSPMIALVASSRSVQQLGRGRELAAARARSAGKRARSFPPCQLLCQMRSVMITGTRAATTPVRRSGWSARRRLGDLNPGWARTQTALAVRRHRPD